MRDELSGQFGTFQPEPSHEDPVRRAQIQMKRPLPKRFYKDVSVEQRDRGFSIQLDGKAVKTPARNDLSVPTKALASLIADEWRAQGEFIDPSTMPVTKLVNTAIDAVSQQIDPVFAEVLNFAGSDMLFYRADAPKELVERQSASWDPIVDWAASALGARFILAEGIVHREQPAEALAAFGSALQKHRGEIALSCLHTMTTLTGSALLALAFAEKRIGLDVAWQLAHLEEDWTEEHWGIDPEAQARRAKRFEEMRAAAVVLESLGG